MFRRLLTWKMAMKCADLGHLGAPTHVHLKWVHLLEEEMFQQGDFEKARSYPVSPLMDRDKGGITSSQPGVRRREGGGKVRGKGGTRAGSPAANRG